MPPKRRLDNGGKDDSSENPVKRRRKVEVRYDPDNTGETATDKETQDSEMEFCQELYDTIRNHKTEDGRLLCEAFIRAPKRRSEPEYHKLVTIPIDLLKIQHKLQTEEYDEIDQLTTDIQLMVNNAKAYYKKTSQEYKDACDLWDLYMDTKNILLAEAFGDMPMDNSSSQDIPQNIPQNITININNTPNLNEAPQLLTPTSVNTDREDDSMSRDDLSSTVTEDEQDHSQFEQLFSAIITAQDSGRILSEMFKILPSRQKYPEYYEVIRNPIDLRTIAKKITGNAYTCLDEMVKDLMLMVQNAKSFNEPGSQIYKDAMILRRIIMNKRTDIENARPRKASQRIRSRRQVAAGSPRLSAVCAALPDDASVGPEQDTMVYEEDSCAEGSITECEDSPQWTLYNSVTSHKSPLGFNVAEPFMRLPSRRVYPDYYEEIKQPMSLLNVQKRLKMGYYPTVDSLIVDMDLVFENAKQYNIDESKLYKDAVKLQQAMKAKKRDLQGRLTADLDDLSEGEDYESASEVPIRPVHVGRGRPRLDLSPNGEERKKPGRSKALTPEETLKKRLWELYKTVYAYKVEGRNLIDIFMWLPSKKDYPDYYQVISEPIDMTTIETKIKGDKYQTEQSIIADFELMFNNARHYNEENSQVYRDAETLEKILKSRVRSLPPLDGSPRASKVSARSAKTPKGKAMSPLALKLIELYNTIKDYTDSRGRILSTPFMKLPLRSEYPDYYEVIKRPIDMQKVYNKMQSNQYESVEDAVSDYVQMFDNACKYNEPDSLIYKDALTLQRVCLEKKQELSSEDNNDVPDVKAVVQELLMNLYIATYNHADEDSRSYSDSFQDMPSPPGPEEGEGENNATAVKKIPSFEKVKKNLDLGCYRRMDRFQEDMFEVFEYARRVSRTDSQLYEDAVELQMFFIKRRNEICKNGEILLTPAVSYTERHLQLSVELEKKEKLPKEQKEDEKKKQQEAEEGKKGDGNKEPQTSLAGSETSVEHKGLTYHVGDFVYVEPRDKNAEPHIVCIEKLWRDQLGELWFHGNWFYRPKETYHLATKKFLEKEVFKSDFWDNTPFSRVVGKCYVMNVRDYFKMMPEPNAELGFSDSDIYVCESRYSAKHKAFKKIKIWALPKNETIRIVAREKVLTPVRVVSVFADEPMAPAKTADIEISGEQAPVIDNKRNIVEAENVPDAEEGFTYYEQFHTPAGWFKLGDCVYVRSDEERPYIARIDKMWTDRSGEAFFHGPWYIHPLDVDHAPTRLFYAKEVFKSSVDDTNPMMSIQGRCAVMFYKDYCSSRITEIPEVDVFVCESKYIEAEKTIKKISKTLKKHTPSPLVCDDETYFFKKNIVPHKEPSPLLLKASEEMYSEMDDDLIPGEASFSQNFSFGPDQTEDTPSEPSSTVKKKKEKSKSWQPSGYIVFSSECRKGVQDANPDLSFGEISKVVGQKGRGRKGNASAYLVYAAECRRIIQSENPEMTFGEISKVVGAKWRELPKPEKTRYEEKAKKIAEEQAAKQEAAERAFNESLAMYPPSASPAPDHRMSPATGRSNGAHYSGYPQHPQQGYAPSPSQRPTPQGVVYPGQHAPGPQMHAGVAGSPPLYQGMHSRPPSTMPPPHPGTPRGMPPLFQSYPIHAGMYPHTRYPYLHPHAQGQSSIVVYRGYPSQGQNVVAAPPPRPPSPMFVSVPPRTQRLLHSEAYLRYIEGLTPENSDRVSDWEKSFHATPENTQISKHNKLPVHWLGQGNGHHGNTVNALWAMRDLMMKDSLTVQRTLEFSQLW